MSENGKMQEGGEKGDAGADPKQSANGDGSHGPVPYDRFKEVNERAKAAEERLKTLEKKQEEAEAEADKKRQSKLAEQQKFQTLAAEWEGKYTELQPQLENAQEELKVAQEILEAHAEAQMEMVPEAFRSVVAKLPLAERLAWLTENAETLTKNNPKGVPPTPQGKGASEISDEERRRLSARTF